VLGRLEGVDRDELLAQLYAEHHAATVRLAWALCRDQAGAEELTQEAFVRLYLHRRSLRDPAAAPAYLRRTVTNLAIDRGRRLRRERQVRDQSDDGPADRRAPGRAAAADGDRAANLDLVDALDVLAPRRRACVVLRYYLDLSEVDTAAALGISVGTVKSQTHKALAQLRSHLQPGEPGQADSADEAASGAAATIPGTVGPAGPEEESR
jgi:RNA polymerase sigma-70 factor (sigma-E family)